MNLKTTQIRSPKIPHKTTIEIACLTAVVGFLMVVWLQPWFDYRLMFLDTLVAATMADVCCPTWFGSISMLGILVWTATAAICLVGAAVLALFDAPKNRTAFCISAGTLTLILALDDAYMLHEAVLPDLGIPQNAVLGGLAVLAAAHLIGFRSTILRHSVWVLVIALAAFSESVLVDLFLHSPSPLKSFVEDGSKFLGIAAWLVFHSFAVLEEILDTSQAADLPGAKIEN